MQKRLIETAVEMGFFPLVVDMNENAPGFQLDVEPLISDISKPDETLLKVREFFNEKKESPLACLTCGTDFSYTVAVINDFYKLNGVSTESARLASNKILMREVFKKNGLEQPKFIGLKKIEDFEGLPFPFPCIVKPSDNMGARGVKIIDNETSLKEYLATAFSFSKKGEIIIEELVLGSEYSLDALVMNGEIYISGFADRLIAHAPFRVEIGHHLPSRAPSNVKIEVIETFKKAVEALGIVDGFAKGDVFFDLQKKRGSIGEIAARLSGGFMSSYTYPLSSGVNLMKNAIYLALGDYSKIDLKEETSFYCLERAIISTETGVIESIKGIEEAKKLEGVANIFLLKEKNSFICPPRNNTEKIGNIIVRHSSFDEAEKITQKALSLIRVKVKPDLSE